LYEQSKERHERTIDLWENAILAMALLWASHAVGLMGHAWIEAGDTEGLMMGRGYRYARRRSLVATPGSSDVLTVTFDSSEVDEQLSNISGFSVPGPLFNPGLLLRSQRIHVNMTKLEVK
jgi:hypothetical protein